MEASNRAKLKLQELGRVSVDTYRSQSKLPVHIVLDNLRSGLNVGSFFRTCDSFALESIILTGISPTPPHKEIHKSAIGATDSVTHTYFESIDDAIDTLKVNGVTLIGIEQTNQSVHLADFTWPEGPIAIVFGNEVEGVSASIIHKLDYVVDLQQYGTKHSLNVAVCGGIVLWDAAKALRER